MAIDNPNVIDIISESPIGEVVLTVADHLAWDDSKGHQITLQTKLNGYLRFIESGEIFEHRPHARTSRIVIHIVGRFEPDADGRLFLKKAQAIVEEAGFGFDYRLSAA